MTVHDPLRRERQAHREIGSTEISRRLAAALTAALLLTAVAVPVAELGSSDSLEAWLALGAGARRAADVLADRGPLAANRELLAAMDAFEDRLDEESAVRLLALPPAQWLQTALLGVGTDEVLVGEGEWLFFHPAVRHLTGPGFLEPSVLSRRAEEGDSWRPPPQPDPVAALIALDRDLAAHGIDLLVVPTPVKASLHPDRFTSASPPPAEPLRNPSWPTFLDRLAAAGVAVHDPAPALLDAARTTGEPQFLATDTHWTPAAVDRAAFDLAERIARDALLPPLPPTPYRTRPAEATARGDLADLLSLPTTSHLYPPRTVALARVETPDGRTWTPDRAADLLLLGDSYTNVYSQPALGWGESAGLAEHLSRHLARPVDRIAVNAGGAHTSRARLYDLLAHDHPRLTPKRLVVYQFSTRELSNGDWKLYDPQTGAPLDPPPGRLHPLLATLDPASRPNSLPDSPPESTPSDTDPHSGRAGRSPLGSPSAAPEAPPGLHDPPRAADEQARADRPRPPRSARRSPGESARPAPAPTSPSASASASPSASASASASALDLGEGHIVWESNRTGNWRIFYRRLDGTGLRQLTPEEPNLQHCCPHLSPDGTQLVYLARPGTQSTYPEHLVTGPLRLLTLDPQTGTPLTERTVAERAATYGWADRAAIWRNDNELIHVGPEGRTHLLDLATGATRPLTTEPRDPLGWLIDPTLRWATHASASFSPYDRAARRVLERPALGGCEAYLTSDGRWGYFIAAGGGPIDRIDLESGEISTVLRKFDPRMPGREGYLYFPMVSRDGRLLAFGASAGEHDHFRSDYDVYAVPIDPATLELEGTPVRLSDDPATDRYPDAWLAPLPLGRHGGEAPLTVDFPHPESGWREAEWEFGDGTHGRGVPGAGRTVRHAYAEPGSYEVVARRGGETLRGRVTVRPAAPPQVLEVAARRAARALEVTFDEPVTLTAGFHASLGSGLGIAGHRLDAGGRRLVLDLAGALTGADRLRLAGVADRAQRPNPMPPAVLEVAAPSWPSDRTALLFLWQTGERPNEVFDPELRADVADPLTAHGRARFDRFQRMVLGGGWFSAAESAGERLLAAARHGNEVTLEATVTPAAAATDGLAPIVTFSRGPGVRNLTLGQDGRWLVARVRTGPTGPNADRPQVRLFPVAAGKAYHLTVTYAPGRLDAYRNGQRVVESQAIQGGLDRWRRSPLAFGAEPGGEGDWAGTVEGIALYGRRLEPAEVRENFLRYRELFLARKTGPEAARLVVRATLDQTSAVPSLRQISPYRQALAVHAWRVERVIEGDPAAVRPGDRLRVAHWVLLDGERTPAAGLRPGATRRLVLEPFDANPQLEAHYLSQTLGDPPAGRLWFAAGE